jgi:RNA polymerase sigma-70 factor (ECF subfamily)
MAVTTKNLPQLYRFCFLMTGDAAKAKQAFQDTVRDAASRTEEDAAPPDRLWFFREARERCIALGEQGIQAEADMMEEVEISPTAAAQIGQLEPAQLALWISAAPEPQRSALALFYLDEFTLAELMSLLDMKPPELSAHICGGRRQFQSWLDSTTAYYGGEAHDAGQI